MPIWLMNTMVKTGLFKKWQAKKTQVICWYYKGKVGGGFTYWPDGEQYGHAIRGGADDRLRSRNAA